MSPTTGTLSIHTENIFPIIKKFLYSNQEVFLRELVSNAVDATQKLQTLANVGDFQGELGSLQIEIKLDKAAGTLTISDVGIGMTADEVEKYINQIAFSSAEEFLGKYKDAKNIIGHFGLGFYSAFMVAYKVELVTRSYKTDAEAVRWTCDGSTSFSLEPAVREQRGTDVILHINSESAEYLEEHRIQDILLKHCKFLPIEVAFQGKVINNTTPLWTRKPAETGAEEYEKFYQELYPFSETPLFWIHLNVDYPFNLTGILYFPKLKPDVELQKNRIKLYSNQVFITDEVDEIVPDYLTLLHGVIDSPDIPLNVSRSYLQTDANVKKISTHIAKKVADKLNELFTETRSAFEEKWDSLGVFVKYGMLRDNTFYERARKCCLVQNVTDKYFTLDEYRDAVSATQTDKNNKVVYLYTTDRAGQDAYVQAAQKRGYDVLLLNGVIDSHFISFIETKLEDATLVRVDADSLEKLIDKGIEKASLLNTEEEGLLKALFEKAADNKLATVQFQVLREDDMPVLIARPEHTRRMKEMARNGMFGMGDFPEHFYIIINSGHSLPKSILLREEATQIEIARHLYNLALLQQGMLTGAEMTRFVENSIALAGK